MASGNKTVWLAGAAAASCWLRRRSVESNASVAKAWERQIKLIVTSCIWIMVDL